MNGYDGNLGAISANFEAAAPQDILSWAMSQYSNRIVLACSFGGPSGMVLLDMAMGLDRSLPVYYLDTEALFPETYELIRRVQKHYGITPIAVRAEHTLAEQKRFCGDALWERDPDACCALRKVAPNRKFLKDYDAWISGVRRDQAHTRATLQIVESDRQFGLVKISPLAAWDERMVWVYIRTHGVPYNALHEANYPSLGCTYCTRPVSAGQDNRSGRWPNSEKTECGLHVTLETNVRER